MILYPDMLKNKAIDGDIVNIDNVFTIKKSYYIDKDNKDTEYPIIVFISSANFLINWFYEDSYIRDSAYDELKYLFNKVD